jgi:hypothetical protein
MTHYYTDHGNSQNKNSLASKEDEKKDCPEAGHNTKNLNGSTEQEFSTKTRWISKTRGRI